jgi:hypothetical protein
MAITKEVLDELLKEYKGPDDFYGPEGLIKQFRTKVRAKPLSNGSCRPN